MSSKPSSVPVWNTGGANNVDPGGAKKILGWILSDQPPSSFLNWLMKLYGEWCQYVSDGVFTQATTNANCITATGNGTGAGVRATSGSGAAGVVGITLSSFGGVEGYSADVANSVGVFGGTGGANAYSGVQGVGSDGNVAGVYGNITAVTSSSTNSAGVRGSGTDVANTASAYGVIAEGKNASPVRSAFRIIPQAAQPSQGQVGDLYMTTAGVLKVCTVAGSPGTWVSVGTQV